MYIKYYRYICILIIAYTLVFTPDICGQIYTPQGSYVQSSKSGTTDTYIYSKDFNISETAN